MRMLKQKLHRGVKAPNCRLMSISPKDNNQRKNQKLKSNLSSWIKSSTLMMMLVLGMFSMPVLSAQSPCTGNVAIENLANGMDYTILSDASGNVDITVTVVDNPVGLVGFFGGSGNPISFPDPTGTFSYSLTGQTVGDPFDLNMFFNWASGGNGNSDTVTFIVGDCAPAADACTGNVPIENLANGMDYSITSDSAGNVDISVTVVDNPAGLVGFYGGAGNPISFPDVNGTFTYNITGETDGAIFTLNMTFNWAGSAGNSEPVSIIVNGACSVVIPTEPAIAAPVPSCDTTDVISMFSNAYTDVPVDTWLTPWSPAATVLTDLQVVGDDAKLYENVDFFGIEMFGSPIDASGMTSFHIDVWTPNMTTFRVKLVDFSGPVTEGEIALTPVQLGWNSFVIPMADFANAALVTNSAFTLDNTTAISQMILSGLPAGGGTLFIDNVYFSNVNCPPAPPVVISISDPCNCDAQIIINGVTFAQETITITPGLAPYTVTAIAGLFDATGTLYTTATATTAITGTTLIGYVPADNAAVHSITIADANGSSASLNGGPCPICPICTLAAGVCVDCEDCEESVQIDLMSGAPFAAANGPGLTTYDGATNTGTITLMNGSANVFSAAGVNGLAFPTYVNDVCFNVDIDVQSGDYPFLIEFRIENGTGAPGNGGQALVFDAMVDGPGVCSLGGSIADGTAVNGFIFDSGRMNSVVIAIADFSGAPIANDIAVEFSNISLSICAGDDLAPALVCPGSEELLLNGDFSDLLSISDFANWTEYGNVFADGNYRLPALSTVKVFGAGAGVFQDAPVAAGEMICMDANFITNSLDGMIGQPSFAEVKIEFYDAANVIINGPFGTVLDTYNPTVPNVWTNVGGCIEAPANTATARAVINYSHPNGFPGACGFDDVSMRRVTPMVFEVNTAGCLADITIGNPTPTDDCEVVTFTNDFNNTDNASGTYPEGSTLVTYTASDANGNQSVCSILVEVGDTQGPIIDCPSDIGVQLEPGECEEIVFFNVPFSDFCGPIDAEASQAINEALVNTALDCAGNTSNHLRYFENSFLAPIEITQVNFGIFNAGASETVTVNIYSIAPGALFEYGNMTLQGTVDY
ncbi:MAG: hypothetical protein ACI86M_000598, partial [Saprospiraceae bacterium]